MAPTRTVKRTTKTAVASATRVVQNLRQYLALKSQADLLNDQVDGLKKALSEVVDTQGYEDDKGNYWFDLPEPVEGITRLKREKRIYKALNEEQAEKLLRDKGLWKPVSKGGVVRTIEVIDEEEVNKAYFKGELTIAEIDSIYQVRSNFAFKPLKS